MRILKELGELVGLTKPTRRRRKHKAITSSRRAKATRRKRNSKGRFVK